MLRSRAFSKVSVVQRRNISYKLPTIKTLDSINTSGEDFNGLFSNKAIKQLWFQQGNHYLDGLNHILDEQVVTNRPESLNELVKETFNKPDLYGAHLYAAYLYNLQFFFELLKPSNEVGAKCLVEQGKPDDLFRSPSTEESFKNEPSQPELKEWLQYSFGSIPEFRTLLLNSAHAIKGNGTTWLVAQAFYLGKAQKDNLNLYHNLAIVNTYNSGSIYETLRSGQLSRMELEKKAKAEFLKKRSEEDGVVNTAEDNTVSDPLVLGTVEQAEAVGLFQKKELIPLLAIDASPRSYYFDYGVYGKQQYLDNVWDCIDWSVVESRAPPRYKPIIDYI